MWYISLNYIIHNNGISHELKICAFLGINGFWILLLMVEFRPCDGDVSMVTGHMMVMSPWLQVMWWWCLHGNRSCNGDVSMVTGHVMVMSPWLPFMWWWCLMVTGHVMVMSPWLQVMWWWCVHGNRSCDGDVSMVTGHVMVMCPW